MIRPAEVSHWVEQDAEREREEDSEIWEGISEVSVRRQRVTQRKSTLRQESGLGVGLVFQVIG